MAREGWDLLWGCCIRMLMSSPHLACLLHAPSASSQPTAPLHPLPSPHPPPLLAPAKAKEGNTWYIIDETAPTPAQILCNEQPAVLESLGKMLGIMHIQH